MNSKILLLTLFLSILAMTSQNASGLNTTTRMPRLVVFNGNGAYHTAIAGFTANASDWGFEVYSTTYLDAGILGSAEMLILNAPQFLTEVEQGYIKSWWNSGNRTLWFSGDSDFDGDYTGYSDQNNLSVQLGLNVILQDDAISDAESNDGAGYRAIANTTNTDFTEFSLVGITNGTFHGPCPVAPYNGSTDGINDMPNWDDLPYVDWVWNTSVGGSIQDQDFDADNVWEGYPPLAEGSFSLLAVEWHAGPNNLSKAIWSGEAIFSDYKNMFGKISEKGLAALQTITLVENMLKWAVDPTTFTTRGPNIVVFNGNGAYHTAIDGFTANATAWGYNVIDTNYLNGIVLEVTDILILNAPQFLTDTEVKLIETWWNNGNRTLWFSGESDFDGDYTGYADQNSLAVSLGLNVILQDDAISDAESNDGAGYRAIANTTNPDFIEFSLAGITNGTFHGPCPVAPYNGSADGINDMPNWDDLLYVDWVWNTSVGGSIQDQDFDADNVWEGYPPLAEGSFSLLAVEWNTGPKSNSNAIWSGEAIFSDYKNMFGKISEKGLAALQTITLVENMLEWAHPSSNTYFDEVALEDVYPPELAGISNNIRDGDFLYDNEELEVSFSVVDFYYSLFELEKVEVLYTVNSGDEMSATVKQDSYLGFSAIIGPFAAEDLVAFKIRATDMGEFSVTSYDMSFDVMYSDTVGPDIANAAINPATDIEPSTVVTVTADVNDTANTLEVISGTDTAIVQYSTDDGTTWTDLTMTLDSGVTYTAELPTFDDGTSVRVKIFAEDMAGNNATSTELTFDVAEPVIPTTTTTTPVVTTTTTTTEAATSGFGILTLLLSITVVIVTLRRKRR